MKAHCSQQSEKAKGGGRARSKKKKRQEHCARGGRKIVLDILR